MRRAFVACAVAAVSCLFAACGSDDSSGNAFPGGGDDGGAGGDGSDARTCAVGQIVCGGACTDTSRDGANCGGCGNACDGATCCQGRCVLDTTSCAFALLDIKGDNNAAEGNQNGGGWFTLTGAGFTPGMRVRIGDGVAPVRVTSATTATIVSPPGPIGPHDVTIVSGLQKATLPDAFLYVAGDVVLPWTEKPMSVVRGEKPGLAVMRDDRVLIAGGTTVPDSAANMLDSADVYDRSTDSDKAVASKMSIARWNLSATTMLDEKVLVAGGNSTSPKADVFDPKTSTFSPTAQPMTVARDYGTSAVLMADGRVMITSAGRQDVDIYDPNVGSFTSLATVGVHTYGIIVRLRDGRILLAGGDGGVTAAEIWDPASGKFAAAAPMNTPRTMFTAHVLPDSRVIVIGGCTLSAGGVTVPLDTIELYDPKANTWTTASYKMSNVRCWHASALVRDGTVMAMGGYDTDKSCHPTNTVDQIDPVKQTVKTFGTLANPNTEWNAVTLIDGSVLGVGGGACGTPIALPSLDFLPGKPGNQ